MGAAEEIVRERVRQVLETSGMSAAQFAKKIHLDPTKLSKSLTGTRRFTSFELASIAAEGGTTIDWLLGGEEARAAVATRHPSGVEPTIQTALERAWTYCETDQTLRRLIKTPPLPALPQPPSESDPALEAGSELADRVLARVQEAGIALHVLRESPARIIEDVFGINVAFEPFEDSLDGLAFATEHFRLVMINGRVSWSRQRFTLAHECGHILSRDGADTEGARIDRNVMETGSGRRHVSEVRANAFAAAVLMPSTDVEAQFADGITQERFAQAVGRYLVSPSALAWRLVNLRLLKTSAARPFLTMSISRAASLGGWASTFDTMTVEHSQPRHPLTLSMRAAQAFLAGTISARPLAAVLNVPPETVISPPCADLAGEEPVFAP